MGPSVSPGSGDGEALGEGDSIGPELGTGLGESEAFSGGAVTGAMTCGAGEPAGLGEYDGIGGGVAPVLASGRGIRISGPAGATGGPMYGAGVGAAEGEFAAGAGLAGLVGLARGEPLASGAGDVAACASRAAAPAGAPGRQLEFSRASTRASSAALDGAATPAAPSGALPAPARAGMTDSVNESAMHVTPKRRSSARVTGPRARRASRPRRP